MSPDELADALVDLIDRSPVAGALALGGPLCAGPLEEHYPDEGDGLYVDYPDGTRFKLTIVRTTTE